MYLYLESYLLLCFILEYNVIGNDEALKEFPGILFIFSEGIWCYQLITHRIALNTTLRTFDIHDDNKATCFT